MAKKTTAKSTTAKDAETPRTSRLAAGTQTSLKTLYTQEQLDALAGMKKKGLELGAARPEFVNHLLFPDGAVSTDIEGMKAAAKEAVVQLLAGDASDPAVLAKATEAARKAKEIDEHLSQNRFLFVVDENQLPIIYFQCATPGNPDVR